MPGAAGAARPGIRLLSHLIVLVGLLGIGVAAAQAPKPNVIVILADDLGYGDVACNNPEGKIATPRIDRLAGEGMRLTDALNALSAASIENLLKIAA